MSGGWCTIESDPAVFTEMLERFGASGVAVEELMTLDDAELASHGTIFGLVLLFKWKKAAATSSAARAAAAAASAAGGASDAGDDAPIYFARQVVSNACATQAIVNIVLNYPDRIELGDTLRGFLEFTQGLDAHTRGEQIGESPVLREVHNSFSRPAAFSFDERHAREDDDVYHFVGYIFKAGAVWELDGLQPAPVRVAPVPGATAEQQAAWLPALREAVQARMAEVSAADTSGAGQGISFALMAVCADRVPALETEIARRMSAEEPVEELVAQLQELQDTRERGKVENARRRHNYIPAIVALLRALAEKGELEGAMKEATDRAAERKAAKAARKKQ